MIYFYKAWEFREVKYHIHCQVAEFKTRAKIEENKMRGVSETPLASLCGY